MNRKTINTERAEGKTFWHPAFLPALKLEFDKYHDKLQFISDHHLNTKPLEIDAIVIKKNAGIVIDNPIGRIFKEYNIFEYKSPTDTFSTDDLHKSIIYLYMYKILEGLDIRDMTLSIVLTKHPREVFKHIRDVWKQEITEKESGIHIVSNSEFPIQIIENKKLSEEDNVYLRALNKDLDIESLERWTAKINRWKRKADISVYTDVILKANTKRFKEIFMRRNRDAELEKMLEEVGLTAKWEARGEARTEKRFEPQIEERSNQKLLKAAQNFVDMGIEIDKVATATGLDVKTVRSLYRKGKAHS
jgi:hypothetical protein